MKINNPAWFAARKDKKLSAMVIIQRDEQNENGKLCKRTYISLCIAHSEKYTEKVDTIFVEADTEIRVDNYSGCDSNSKREITQIWFNNSVSREDSHLRAFLNAVKKLLQKLYGKSEGSIVEKWIFSVMKILSSRLQIKLKYLLASMS